MATDFAEVLLLEQPGRSDPALHHLPIAPPRDVRRAARHTALRTLDHIGCGKAFVRRRWRCKENISPRQHFVCVEAVLGEVSEWIVVHSENGWALGGPALAGVLEGARRGGAAVSTAGARASPARARARAHVGQTRALPTGECATLTPFLPAGPDERPEAPLPALPNARLQLRVMKRSCARAGPRPPPRAAPSPRRAR